MRNGMKKAISVAVAVLTTATLAVTAFAADYADVPVFNSTPSETVSVKTEEVKDVIAKADDNAAASVEVSSTQNLSLNASVMKALVKSESAVLEIVSPKATISIDASTITKARKIDLSAKVYGSEKRTVVKMRSVKDFGCEVKITVTSCKLSAAKLAKAHVYCDGVDLGAVELDENGNPVITVTKGGTYIIK